MPDPPGGDSNCDAASTQTSNTDLFTQSEDLSVIFRDLCFTVKIAHKPDEKEEDQETREEGDQPAEEQVEVEGAAPAQKKRRTKRRWKKKKVEYTEKNIIDGMTGIFRAGRLTAVMGASGAGKTTLLSVLAGNIQGGTPAGVIQVNNEDFSDVGKMQKISGFVFQDDILLPTMKVKEAIEMSALLRLPKDITQEERENRVENIIKLLHLRRAAKTKVGDPMQKGISGGERKRTSIAMEVVTDPAMLFLDEPTTGLDTYTAYTVIKVLQNLAHKQGRTIVSTIHQPSSETFYLFDDLLVLAEGKVVYYGSVEESIGYFERLGFACPQYTNPADYFFMNILSDIDAGEIEGFLEGGTSTSAASKRETRPVSWIPEGLTEKASDRIARIIEAWPQSPEHAQMIELIEAESQRPLSELAYKGHASYWTQFTYLSKRASKNALRNPRIVTVKLIQAIFIGVILALIFMNQSQYDPMSQIRNISGVLFFFNVHHFYGYASVVLAIFYEEKAVFYREYAAGYYRLSAYYWTKVLCEVPYGILFPYLMVIICYYAIGLNPAFSAYLLIGFLCVLVGLCGTATGIFLAAATNQLRHALAILPIILLPVMLFGGLFVSSNAVPGWLSWLQYLSPIKYGYSAMVQVQFGGRELANCDPASGMCSDDFVYQVLGLTSSPSIGLSIIILIVFVIVLFVGAFLVLWLKLHKIGGQKYEWKKKAPASIQS